ncbi:MAG: hypothetical protein MJE12_15620 [Alphaproteobacteria bacterium]|nr:hypothetical protein [Alphaproteobacteria bacterium]
MALNLTGGAGSGVLINGRVEVHPGQPIPELDCGPAAAFAAVELRDTSRRLYALLADVRYPMRWDYVAGVRRIDNNHLVRTIDWDVVTWPGDGKRRAVLVLEQPAGPRLMSTPGETFAAFAEEPLTRRVIQPLAHVLNDLAFHGLAHRNVRVGNLFFDGGDPATSPIMLGECLSTPPGFMQPAIYEPLEYAMADPAGRGDGTHEADLYAFGVVLIALLTGREPLVGQSDEDVIQAKLAKGSYAALMADQRVSLPLMEVLRGLLNDDPRERWTLEDLENWIGGRRLSPRQQIMPAKGVRPLEFAGRYLSTARDVAEGFSRNWDAGIAAVQNGTLADWLRRSLSHEATIDAVNDARATNADDESTVDDGAMARICIALDPAGPIRLRTLRAVFSGIGNLLASNHQNEALRDDFLILVGENIAQFWVGRTSQPSLDSVRILGILERIRTYIDRSGMGQGYERAIYDLAPAAPCRSPLLEGDFVHTPGELLLVLERIAESNPGMLGNIIDVHIAAFISARMKVSINAELHDLQEGIDPFQSALAAARILSVVQDSTRVGPVPALCSVVVKMLEPGAERYHNRPHRKAVLERLRKAGESGVVNNLLAAIDDREDLKADELLYQQAVAQYVESVVGQQRLEFERKHRPALARELSGQISTLIAGVSATISILVVILVELI